MPSNTASLLPDISGKTSDTSVFVCSSVLNSRYKFTPSAVNSTSKPFPPSPCKCGKRARSFFISCCNSNFNDFFMGACDISEKSNGKFSA